MITILRIIGSVLAGCIGAALFAFAANTIFGMMTASTWLYPVVVEPLTMMFGVIGFITGFVWWLGRM